MALSVACSRTLVGVEVAAAHSLPRSRTLLAGVVSSAGQYPSWNRAFDGRLRLRMVFQAWAFNVDPANVLNGPGTPVISWEPWRTPPLGTPIGRQGAPQRVYSNSAIATGKWDSYLHRWAVAIKAYRRPVVLRPMAEFNGFWYPWSRDPREFVRAWRDIWNLFHAVRADNVTWAWSFQVNSNAQGGPRTVLPRSPRPGPPVVSPPDDDQRSQHGVWREDPVAHPTSRRIVPTAVQRRVRVESGPERAGGTQSRLGRHGLGRPQGSSRSHALGVDRVIPTVTGEPVLTRTHQYQVLRNSVVTY